MVITSANKRSCLSSSRVPASLRHNKETYPSGVLIAGTDAFDDRPLEGHRRHCCSPPLLLAYILLVASTDDRILLRVSSTRWRPLLAFYTDADHLPSHRFIPAVADHPPSRSLPLLVCCERLFNCFMVPVHLFSCCCRRCLSSGLCFSSWLPQEKR